MTFIGGMSKYNNHKVEIDSYKFDSKKEGSRYLILRQMQKEEEIANLKVPSNLFFLGRRRDEPGIRD
jgi:hypothetical protein